MLSLLLRLKNLAEMAWEQCYFFLRGEKRAD